jgi:hypothetical protein
MTGFTCDRTPFFTGLFLFSVAFYAQLFHYLFFLQFALSFKLLDNARLLGKYGMADFTVDEHILVAMVGKWNFSGFTSSQGNLFGSFIFDSLRYCNNQHHDDNKPGNRFGLHFSIPHTLNFSRFKNRNNIQQTV